MPSPRRSEMINTPDMVGSVEATLVPWGGLTGVPGQPTGAPAGAVDCVIEDRDLAWHTTVGQVIFLQSVVHEQT